MQLFGTKEQKFHHCPRTKGRAKILAKGQDGPEQLNAGTAKKLERDAGQKRIFYRVFHSEMCETKALDGHLKLNFHS